MTPKTSPGTERRRALRRPVLDSFSLFAVVPKKGPHRLKIHDVSDLGIGFDLDIEGEVAETFPLKAGERLEVQFYLNQTLFLPVRIQVARVTEKDSLRRVGAEFIDKNEPGYKGLASFVNMLDSIIDAAHLSPGL